MFCYWQIIQLISPNPCCTCLNKLYYFLSFICSTSHSVYSNKTPQLIAPVNKELYMDYVLPTVSMYTRPLFDSTAHCSTPPPASFIISWSMCWRHWMINIKCMLNWNIVDGWFVLKCWNSTLPHIIIMTLTDLYVIINNIYVIYSHHPFSLYPNTKRVYCIGKETDVLGALLLNSARRSVA